jgi:hypothetical protein
MLSCSTELVQQHRTLYCCYRPRRLFFWILKKRREKLQLYPRLYPIEYPSPPVEAYHTLTRGGQTENKCRGRAACSCRSRSRRGAAASNRATRNSAKWDRLGRGDVGSSRAAGACRFPQRPAWRWRPPHPAGYFYHRPAPPRFPPLSFHSASRVPWPRQPLPSTSRHCCVSTQGTVLASLSHPVAPNSRRPLTDLASPVESYRSAERSCV